MEIFRILSLSEFVPSPTTLKSKQNKNLPTFHLACVAGGIVGARKKVLAYGLKFIPTYAKTLLRAPTIPPATQATFHLKFALDPSSKGI